MNPLSRRFLQVAVISAIAGMGLGVMMGATGNYILAPVHAHISLLGWVSMALFGLFYQCVPEAAVGPLPRLHFWLSGLGTNLFVPSLASLLLGYTVMRPVAILAGILSMVGTACFGAVVLRTRRGITVNTRYQPAVGQALAWSTEQK